MSNDYPTGSRLKIKSNRSRAQANGVGENPLNRNARENDIVSTVK